MGKVPAMAEFHLVESASALHYGLVPLHRDFDRFKRHERVRRRWAKDT